MSAPALCPYNFDFDIGHDYVPETDRFGNVDVFVQRRDAICIIPARGGSQRIPRKNIRPFHGKPILAYSIEAALDSRLFASVRVSTDDREIAELAIKYGARPIMRPEYDDGARGTQEVVRMCLDQINAVSHTILSQIKYVCTIYATAPMIRPQDLRHAYVILKSNPHIGYVVPCAEWLQDPGMFYFGRYHTVLSHDGFDILRDRVRLMKIPREIAIDINFEEDWVKAERKYKRMMKAKNEHAA